MSKLTNNEFWVSNISDLNVGLRDLQLTIKARTNVNLLDSKHYHYTLDQLISSAQSGSLYKKSNLLKVRQVVPDKPITPGVHLSKEPTFMAKKPLFSRVILEEPKYEELEISETEFINDLINEEDS